MYTEQTGGMILIKQLANGFLVTLPPAEKTYEPNYAAMGPAIVREFRRAQDSDPLLDELQGKGEEPKPEPKPPYELAQATNQFIFETLHEALVFIQGIFMDGAPGM